jgi:hypothetical protein
MPDCLHSACSSLLCCIAHVLDGRTFLAQIKKIIIGEDWRIGKVWLTNTYVSYSVSSMISLVVQVKDHQRNSMSGVKIWSIHTTADSHRYQTAIHYMHDMCIACLVTETKTYFKLGHCALFCASQNINYGGA